MKATSRQAICITRLKKKPSNYNLTSSNDLSICKDSRVQLCEINSNAMSQSKINKDIAYRNPSKNLFPNPEAQVIHYKENIVSHQNLYTVNEHEDLIRRLKDLEHSNQELHRRNHELFNEVQNERKQKSVLNARIDKLSSELQKLESQFQQQYKKALQPKFTIGKITSPQLKITTAKSKQIDLGGRHSESTTGYRRLSFHQAIDSHTEDFSVKAKQYKNQLQIEKIRRYNLQKELKNCKENVKLQFINELEKLQHKIDNMKETITRKDKQISQKEDLIQRFIIKK